MGPKRRVLLSRRGPGPGRAAALQPPLRHPWGVPVLCLLAGRAANAQAAGSPATPRLVSPEQLAALLGFPSRVRARRSPPTSPDLRPLRPRTHVGEDQTSWPSLPTGWASRSPRPQAQPEKLKEAASPLNQRAPRGRPDAPRAGREAPSPPHGQGRPPAPGPPARALGLRDAPPPPRAPDPRPRPELGVERPPGCLPAFLGEEKLAAPELSATGAEASEKPRPGGGSWAGQGGGGARGGGLRADQ